MKLLKRMKIEIEIKVVEYVSDLYDLVGDNMAVCDYCGQVIDKLPCIAIITPLSTHLYHEDCYYQDVEPELKRYSE